MALNTALVAEMKHEGSSTRRMLERVPEDDFGWKPHEKSMTLGRLSTHLAELPSWIISTLNSDELDFTKESYTPKTASTVKELLQLFDDNLAQSLAALEKADDEQLLGKWRLRKGDKLIFELPRTQVIRLNIINHIIHHRGQLSVYLRLQNVPLPPIYGPTADENA